MQYEPLLLFKVKKEIMYLISWIQIDDFRTFKLIWIFNLVPKLFFSCDELNFVGL
jgi:hypothetical protein